MFDPLALIRMGAGASGAVLSVTASPPSLTWTPGEVGNSKTTSMVPAGGLPPYTTFSWTLVDDDNGAFVIASGGSSQSVNIRWDGGGLDQTGLLRGTVTDSNSDQATVDVVLTGGL